MFLRVVFVCVHFFPYSIAAECINKKLRSTQHLFLRNINSVMAIIFPGAALYYLVPPQLGQDSTTKVP